MRAIADTHNGKREAKAQAIDSLHGHVLFAYMSVLARYFVPDQRSRELRELPIVDDMTFEALESERLGSPTPEPALHSGENFAQRAAGAPATRGLDERVGRPLRLRYADDEPTVVTSSQPLVAVAVVRPRLNVRARIRARAARSVRRTRRDRSRP